MQGILGILHKVFFPIMRCSFPIMSHTHTHTHTHTHNRTILTFTLVY